MVRRGRGTTLHVDVQSLHARVVLLHKAAPTEGSRHLKSHRKSQPFEFLDIRSVPEPRVVLCHSDLECATAVPCWVAPHRAECSSAQHALSEFLPGFSNQAV